MKSLALIIMCMFGNGCEEQGMKKNPLTTVESSIFSDFSAINKSSVYFPWIHMGEGQQIFKRMLLSQEELAEKASWDKLGFDVRTAYIKTNLKWIVLEKDDQRKGRGFYLLSPYQKGLPHLQIPHSLSDENTEIIGMQLCHGSNFQSCSFSTVKRTFVDFTHDTQTLFHELTLAMLEMSDPPFIVQLHGFASEKRTTPEGQRADVILSGPAGLDPQCIKAKSQLHFGQWVVMTYGIDVQELGATTNIQGLAMKAAGKGALLHIEMNSEFRSALTKDESLRQSLLRFTRDVQGSCLL